jgi:signal transduction histidine kinase
MLAPVPVWGSRGMQERVRQTGGTLTIESSGKGTIVRATLPLFESVPSQNEDAA